MKMELHCIKQKSPHLRGLLVEILVFSVVDNSLEISNISITPRDIIDTHHIMTLIMKS